MLKGSPDNTQSQEADSKATESENREETNEMEQSMTQKLSDSPDIDGTKDSLTNGNAYKIPVIVDTERQSNASMEDSSKGSFLNENVSTISMEETQNEQVVLQANDSCKEDNDSLKLLTEKLSAALANVSLKDDLVKQHSKVAEEAVAGKFYKCCLKAFCYSYRLSYDDSYLALRIEMPAFNFRISK